MDALQARTPRAERTRRAILDAAEALFAAYGFAATRLEDVAARVGIRRASIVYHYRDKRALYEAVLEDVFGGLYARVEPALLASGPLASRVESAVSRWVDYVGERPSLARLLLREVANAGPGGPPALRRHTLPFAALARRLEAESSAMEAGPGAPDPAHVASAIAGATVFFVAALPALSPEPDFDPLSPGEIEAHRREVLHITRRLLAPAWLHSEPGGRAGD